MSFALRCCAGLAGLFAVAAACVPAHAAPRTFVSSRTGSDANPCTRLAPCLTFQAAHNATDPGGEINCASAGDFNGGVTGNFNITKSITIDCGGVAATFNGFGTIVIDTPGVTVRLRNLSIGGEASTAAIRFTKGAALFVENCVIANLSVDNPRGIDFFPADVTAKLFVVNSTISTILNTITAGGTGILVAPKGSGSALVVVDGVRLENNGNGIIANAKFTSGVIAAQVRNSVFAGGNGIAAFSGPAGGTSSVTLDRSSTVLNVGTGVRADGPQAFVVLAKSTVIGNGIGLQPQNGGNIVSYQDNQLTGNVTDAAPTGVLTVQ
jgi:hypothetical protein